MRISTNQILNQGLNGILDRQAAASRTQQQLATGKRILKPSDDPIALAKIQMMKQRIDSSERFIQNQQAATATLAVEEGLLSNAANVLQRVRELQLQSANSSLTREDRISISYEARELLNELVSIANSQDINGHFIFSGSQTLAQSITQNTNGDYVYNGDDTQRQLQISRGLNVAINDTAADIFMRVREGNGRFSVSDNGAANVGSGVIANGSIIDESQYVVEDYTISFALNSSSELVVLVTGSSSGNLVPVSGLADDAPLYQEGQSIMFNGIEISVSGSPQAGDDFLLQPASNESVFSTIQRMVTNLENSITTDADKARIKNENNQILAQLDNALNNIVDKQAQVGARLNSIDIAEDINRDLILTSKESVSLLEDVDLSEAAVKLNAQTIALQAAQQSFTRIQSLSLFNYL